MIVQYMLEKVGVAVWDAVDSGWGLLTGCSERCNEPWASIKRQGISCLPNQSSASREGRFFMVLVTWLQISNHCK